MTTLMLWSFELLTAVAPGLVAVGRGLVAVARGLWPMTTMRSLWPVVLVDAQPTRPKTHRLDRLFLYNCDCWHYPVANGSVSTWRSGALVQLAPTNLCVEDFALESKRAHVLHCLQHVISAQTEQVGELADDHSSRKAPRRQNAASCLHNIASFFAVTIWIEPQA